MNRFAFTVSAVSEATGTRVLVCGVIEAGSEDEAFGKAHRFSLKKYPTKRFKDHFVWVDSAEPIDTELVTQTDAL